LGLLGPLPPDLSDCVTVMVCPATVTVPVRCVDPVFLAILRATTPPPVPDAPLATVTQEAWLTAAQGQLADVATARLACEDAAPTEMATGVTVTLQLLGGACVIVSVAPPTLIVPVRELDPV